MPTYTDEEMDLLLIGIKEGDAKFANLQAENERLRKALRFYADKNNYEPLDRPIAKQGYCISPVETDDGEKAREALKAY